MTNPATQPGNARSDRWSPNVVAMADRELLTTAQAARSLGISTRTLVRYAERGYIKPEMTLPSGHRRWVLEDIRRQLRELGERGEEN
jgi:MerR family regulatory protein